MAFGAKTNERPGTRAQARYIRMSAYKARVVLDLIRGLPVGEAEEVLGLVERGAADAIVKVLNSAVANAVANDDQDPERLFVSACYADEGPTLKRFRPRARGRASHIRKRTCHITIIVSRLSDKDFEQLQSKASTATAAGKRRERVAASRADRVAKSRKRDEDKAGLDADEEAVATDEVVTEEVASDEVTPQDDVVETDVEESAEESSEEAAADESEEVVAADETKETE